MKLDTLNTYEKDMLANFEILNQNLEKINRTLERII